MDNRRAFVKKISLCCAGVSIGAGLTSCSSLPQVAGTYSEEGVHVQKSPELQLPAVVNNNQRGPFLLVNQNNQLKAYRMICTHKECTLNTAGPILVCPCHGSEFSFRGEVLKGPANKNLSVFPVKETSTNYTILLQS
jgi:Rieske Fe-S protein